MLSYEFSLDNGIVHRFDIRLDPVPQAAKNPASSADWTRLRFHQCANCPLQADDETHCPVAVDIEEVAEKFKDIISFERADVRVISEEREYFRNCDVQTGLKSLLGLVMASSSCPILSKFKPMAQFHLPFSTVDETIYRVTGAYLLKQYFLFKDGSKPDLDLKGLESHYEDMKQVNRDFMQRIRTASESDANLNAINILWSLSAVVGLTLDERLEKMKPLFF
jgi:hypothetical protein